MERVKRLAMSWIFVYFLDQTTIMNNYKNKQKSSMLCFFLYLKTTITFLTFKTTHTKSKKKTTKNEIQNNESLTFLYKD